MRYLPKVCRRAYKGCRFPQAISGMARSIAGKPGENVVHWVRATEKHLRVASVRGTDDQMITYVSQYLEGAADNRDHRRTRNRVGAPQEAFLDWLAALQEEFRSIESAILLRTKFKRIGGRGAGPSAAPQEPVHDCLIWPVPGGCLPLSSCCWRPNAAHVQ